MNIQFVCAVPNTFTEEEVYQRIIEVLYISVLVV